MAENTRNKGNKDRQRQQGPGDRKPPGGGLDPQRQGQSAGQPRPDPDELSDLGKGITDDEDLDEERITQRTPRQHDDVDPPKR